MKKSFFVLLLLAFNFSIAQTTKSGDWTLNQDEYTNSKSIEVPVFKDNYHAARVIIKGVGETFVWNVYEKNEKYLYLSTERLRSTSGVTFFVKINGVNKEFWLPYGNPCFLTPELINAFKTGTEVAFKFNGDPNYYKYSLKGINNAMTWVVK